MNKITHTHVKCINIDANIKVFAFPSG